MVNLQPLLQLLGGTLHSLTMSFCSITTLPSLRPGALPCLTTLSLESCGLHMLPDSISVLTALRCLRLGRNHLESQDLLRLSTLSGLTRLSINGNWDPVEGPPHVPDALWRSLINLVELDARDIAIGELPPCVSRLTALTELRAGRSFLSTLPEEFGQLTALRRLGLEGNHMAALPACLGRLTNLKHLDVSRNT